MSAYIDIIFLVLVVAYIFVRLYNVLGTRPGMGPKIRIVSKDELDHFYQVMQKEMNIKQEIKQNDEPLSPLDQVLCRIPNFDKKDFLARVSKVFEMVVTAFATHDQKTLNMLMKKELYEKFRQIIQYMIVRGEFSETELIKIGDTTIMSADISEDGNARIVVKITSEQINVLKNREGEVIEGDENFVQNVTDMWTFEKNINSASHVWLLVSTKKDQYA